MYYKVGLLKRVLRHVKSGGIIAYPTESCFGLGCDPRNYCAINKILKIKSRNKGKGLIVITGSRNYLEPLILPLDVEEVIHTNRYWPGAYSFIVEVKKNLPSNLTGGRNSLAVRVTKHKLVKQLSDYLQIAIVSTSANRSGYKSVKTYRECLRQFGRDVMVLPGNTLFAKKPSTIINLKTKQILRG